MIDIFSDYTFQIVTIGCVLLGFISGILGSYAVVRKQSLLSDGISHCALPGVVLVFILFNTKQLCYLLFGAVIFGVIAVVLIMFITKYTKIKYDSALALILSSFYGLGLVLLTISQKIPTASTVSLKGFIYGQASSILISDIYFILIIGFILLSIIFLLSKEFKCFCFDKQYMSSLGFNTTFINILLTFLLVIGVVIGLQSVGIVLMSALFIAPGVASKQWVNGIGKMSSLSGFLGGVSSFFGVLINAIYTDVPTSSAIIICLTIIVFVSILFSNKNGLLYKKVKRNLLKKKYVK